MSFGNKKSSSNTTTQNYDQRQVNDASGGGTILGAGASTTKTSTTGTGSKILQSGAQDTTAAPGSILTQVDGYRNVVTDGGAFAIVEQLAASLGNVAAAQTQVARDIALSSTAQGASYAAEVNKAVAKQLEAFQGAAVSSSITDRLTLAAESLAADSKGTDGAPAKTWVVAGLAGVGLILFFLLRK